MSKKPALIGVILAGIIILSILSAGCVGAFSYCPDEVKVHGNIIAVDENVVGEETILSLLFSPNSYESSYISAIESYLPKKNPVIEIGGKFGVITSFVDDIINKNLPHIVVEEDSKYFELLQKTLKNNEIIAYPINAKITYNTSELLGEGKVETLSSILQYNEVEGKTNISLLIDDDNVAKNLFTNEPYIAANIEYIFMNIKDPSLVKLIVKQASLHGYTNITYPVQGSDGYTVLVFKRMDTVSDALTTLVGSANSDETDAANIESTSKTDITNTESASKTDTKVTDIVKDIVKEA